MRNKFVIKLIDAYKNARKNDGKAHCKYLPSCSSYAREAYTKFNFFKASFLTLWRLLRCNPFSKGGYDPVPLTKQEKEDLENRTKEIFKEGFDATAYIIHHI